MGTEHEIEKRMKCANRDENVERNKASQFIVLGNCPVTEHLKIGTINER